MENLDQKINKDSEERREQKQKIVDNAVGISRFNERERRNRALA